MFRLLAFVIFSFSLHQSLGDGDAFYAQDLTEEQLKAAHDAFYSGKELLLTKAQENGVKNRVAIASLTGRWPNGTIPYVIDRSRADLTSSINQAAEHIKSKTNNCIKWVPRTNQQNYVRIFRGGGCYSLLGMSGRGVQDLSLGNGCEPIGTVIHEMLHAVGFDHEQNRPDRDSYLNIYMQNVVQGMKNNFQKTPGGQTFGTKFDFDSVMLYGEYAFSRQPNKLPTMRDKTGKHRLTEPYTKRAMTDMDAFEVKKFYQCR